MTPKRLQSHPLVHQNRDCLAIRRGPFIYALESVDQVSGVSDLRLARIDESAPLESVEMDIEGKSIIAVKTKGSSVKLPQDPTSSRDKNETDQEEGPVDLTFIPYFAWGNRGPSDMRVWIAKSAQRHEI